ncbi:MAG: WecB/TagA/CpsF family glycosyltransferase [Planctomycetes bacterium]|nr:WecB/TagA/CpsF family glycosyltransferase [Planctomycetota bacterium]
MTPFDSYAHAVRCAARIVEEGGKSFWIAMNPEKAHRAGRDERLRRVLNQADVGICDGIGISFAARMLQGRWVPRVTGCDLFFHLLEAARDRGWGVFLFGADPDSNEQAAASLVERYNGLRIVGRHSGYFQDVQPVIEAINASGAQLLFVAMGSPRQEYWIAEHFDRLAPRLCLGVGGSFDVASGKSRRAPGWIRRLGLEFLYRALTTPGWKLGARWERTWVKIRYGLSVLRQRLTGRRSQPPPP